MTIADEKFKRLTPENVKKAPRKRGVYALYAERKLVFLGVASRGKETIQSQLHTHLGAAAQGATRYKRELSASPQARLKKLLAEYVAKHGKNPIQNKA